MARPRGQQSSGNGIVAATASGPMSLPAPLPPPPRAPAVPEAATAERLLSAVLALADDVAGLRADIRARFDPLPTGTPGDPATFRRRMYGPDPS